MKTLCSPAGWKQLANAVLSRMAAPARHGFPEAGLRLADAHGGVWVVRAVFHDEAGPARVVLIPAADLACGRMEAAFSLDLADWCAFRAGKTLSASQAPDPASRPCGSSR